jgi:pyrimidine operon attenuation protein/uracil phosphoribosyltransferase
MTAKAESLILDSESISRTLTRVAHEILERNRDISNLALIGIHRGGSHLAIRLQKLIQEIAKLELPIGFLDIALYRDDVGELGTQAVLQGTDILFDVNGKTVVLVDDVLFTGRTIRCAIDQIIDFGRPKQIQLAVLIDRGHRELPIRADFIGKNMPTSFSEEVKVLLVEDGASEDKVIKNEKVIL